VAVATRAGRDGTAALLAWYRPRRRAYPWRRTRDPYRVLVSEVMLQQTQAARVAPAFERFLAAFPNVDALAAASPGDVLRAWDGLGYNRRALALSATARTIVREHAGRVPSDPGALRSLPGVGPYTTGAVASIAFGAPVVAMDTNLRRVIARAALGVEADDAPPQRLLELAGSWLDVRDPGAWNQAVMDLGREVCRPRPRCDRCPIARSCRFLATGAVLRPARRRQGPFEGSGRQTRGAIVRVLRDGSPATMATLARRAALEPSRVAHAVRDLHREGLVVAGAAALAGRTAGRVRLPG
jgi:A/G-specific adenine glycosylase